MCCKCKIYTRFFFLINLFIYLSYYFCLFIYQFWLCWVFVAVRGLSLVAFSSCHEQGLLFVAVRGLLTAVASLVAEHGLQSAQASVDVARGLSSCGVRAQLLRGMWDLPGPGLEPVSPALAGGFLTTAPPGKPYTRF